MFEETQRLGVWWHGSIGRQSTHITSQLGPGGGRVMVAVADMTSCDHVRELFNRCRRMLRQGIRHVVIDLHTVETADTKLVACLVVVYQMARAASVRLEMCLSKAVLDVARVCRLEWLARVGGSAAEWPDGSSG